MLKTRIIPCLDMRDGKVTKGIKFKNNRDLGDPVELAKRYYDEGADELVIYDITASPEGRGPDTQTIKKVCKSVFIPICVGGGVNSIEIASDCIRSGAEKISINSYAYQNPDLIAQISQKFGVQAVVLSVDVGSDSSCPSGYRCYQNGGRVATPWDALEWIGKMLPLGLGEICVNSIDADGTKAGYDIKLMRSLGEVVNCPMVWSGGAGQLSHLLDACQNGSKALLLASMIHENEFSVGQIKTFLKSHQIPIR